MLKTILSQVKEFKRVSILTPVFVLGEVILEMVIPLLMASTIDEGVTAETSTTSKPPASGCCCWRWSACAWGCSAPGLAPRPQRVWPGTFGGHV